MIELDEICTVGSNLARAECVLCTSNGRTYVSDWRGGATILEPDGSQWSLLAQQPDFEVQPNGITLMQDGSILICHLGADSGGVSRLGDTGGIRRPTGDSRVHSVTYDMQHGEFHNASTRQF